MGTIPPTQVSVGYFSTSATRWWNMLILRGTIVNGTYGIHKKTTWYIFDHFYYQYLVLLTLVPRYSNQNQRRCVNVRGCLFFGVDRGF